VQKSLLILKAVCQLALIAHLARTRLLQRFPFLAIFFFSHLVWIVAGAIPTTPVNREEVWQYGVSVTLAALVAAFLETVHLSLEHYPGISRQAVWGACGVVAAISGILGALEPSNHPTRELLVAQRVLGSAVAVSAIGLLMVLNYFDPRRRPNVVRHERTMAAMAATTALAAWMFNHKQFVRGADLLNFGNILYPIIWIWALRPEGETDSRPPANPLGRKQARAASEQLREYYD